MEDRRLHGQTVEQCLLGSVERGVPWSGQAGNEGFGCFLAAGVYGQQDSLPAPEACLGEDTGKEDDQGLLVLRMAPLGGDGETRCHGCWRFTRHERFASSIPLRRWHLERVGSDSGIGFGAGVASGGESNVDAVLAPFVPMSFRSGQGRRRTAGRRSRLVPVVFRRTLPVLPVPRRRVAVLVLALGVLGAGRG